MKNVIINEKDSVGVCLDGTNEIPAGHKYALRDIKQGDYVYFVHSFSGQDCDESVTSTTDYGVSLTATVENGNVYGAQFHPEKSGEVGLKILKAFTEI